MSSRLAAKKCVPCHGGIPPLNSAEIDRLLSELGGDWTVVDAHHLEKRYAFPDFVSALAFANAVGEVAEDQGHHPDIMVSWGRVQVTIWTHAIDGLTESDFILAAKIDAISTPS
jgi:4a-hydroxytetrahydrobiopterin dehydratase